MPSAKIISTALLFLGWLTFSSGCFTGFFALPTESRFYPSVISVDNFVIFVGGHSSDFVSDAVDILDTNTDSWTSLRLHTRRRFAVVASVGKKVFITGGNDIINIQTTVHDVELLDLETNPPTITLIGAIPYEIDIYSDKVVVLGTNLIFVSSYLAIIQYDYTTNVTTHIRVDADPGTLLLGQDIPFGTFAIGDVGYVVLSRGVYQYTLSNASSPLTWIPFSQPIDEREEIVQAFYILDGVYIVTKESMFTLNVSNFEVAQLHRMSNIVHRAFASNDTIFMFTGPSPEVVNTVTTYHVFHQVKFSLPYTRYSFALQFLAAAASGGKLYVTGWTFNTPLPSTQVLVFDIQNSRYQYTAFEYTDLEVFYEHKDKLYIIAHEADWGRDFIIYDLILKNATARALNNGFVYRSAHSIDGGNQIYFHGEHYLSSSLNVFTVYHLDTGQLRHISIPGDFLKINAFLTVGTKVIVDALFSSPSTQISIFDIITERWSTRNISLTPEHEYNFLKSGDKILIFPTLIELIVQVEVYDYGRDRWSVLQLQTPRLFASLEIVGDTLYIAGGISNTTYLGSIEVFDLNDLSVTELDPLPEPRIMIVIESVYPYIVFAGGELEDYALAPDIDIYNTQTKTWLRSKFPVPELIGLNFRSTTVGSRMFFRYNNYVYILDLMTGRVDPLLIPFMSGAGSHVLGTNIIFFGRYGRLTVYFFYETTTGSVFQLNTPHLYNMIPNLLWRNQFVFFANGVAIVPVPYLLSDMPNQNVFMNQSVVFSVNATGNNLRYNWRLNGRLLNATTSTLEIPQSQLEAGTYSVQVTDHCQATTSQSASLVVYPRPSFAREFSQMIALCNAVARFNVAPNGRGVEVQWILDNTPTAIGNEIEINMTHLHCDTTHQLCAIATNPSGRVQTCGQLQLLDISRVFDGPRPTVNDPFLSTGSRITLQMEILDKRCTSHIWYQDNTYLGSSNEMSSQREIELGVSAQPGSKFHVVAMCGESQLLSDIYQVPVTTLPLWAFIIILIGGVGLIGAIVTVGYINNKRLRRSKEQELELKTMLNQAQQETLAHRMSKGTQFISCVTWEWQPDDAFSFSPIENLPVHVETSHLSFGKKNDLLDVDVWTQGVIEISSKKIKRKPSLSSFLNQRLLEEDPQVTIYVPQSPKFEVKVHPETFTVEDGTNVSVTVSVRLRITTKVKIKLLVVIGNKNVYSSIDFTLASLPSPWIDLEDIQLSKQHLGSGGFGSVVRGTFKGQEVAVKTFIRQDLTELDKIEFEREVMIMRSLRHPNIVQFIGASNIMERLAIVTELAPLGSLASVLAQRLISYPLKLEILVEIARAIQFLHANDIIHRDIKPGNVLVFSLEPRAATHVKVSDFGTSKFVTSEQQLASPMTKDTGTVNYSAPETLDTKPVYTLSADIFSFAILMWEVITNEQSFAWDPEFRWQTKIEEFTRQGKRMEIPREVDHRLAALITDCWAQDPKKRPPIEEVVQRLTILAQDARAHY